MKAAASNPAVAGLALEMRGIAVAAMADPGTILVEGVDWSVAPGDFWVVGGQQGSGKTDFLLMTGGLTAPVNGAYHFFGNGMPMFEENRLGERLQLSMVFDEGKLFNRLTVSENVSLPLRYHRNLTVAGADAEVRPLLDLTGMESWADSTPGAMALAWRKRVGLARALMLKPRVLLLDNPLSGLDLRHRGWWLNFLGQLSRGHPWMEGRPTTLVVTTHDFRPWQGVGRQFAMLKDRRFVVLGSWQQVNAASDERVRELLAVEAGSH